MSCAREPRQLAGTASHQEHTFSGLLCTKPHLRRQPGWMQPCPRSVSGWFRECCILTSPFLGVWLEQVSTLERSECEDSLNKQEKNYNLCLHAAQSTGDQRTVTGPFVECRAQPRLPKRQEGQGQQPRRAGLGSGRTRWYRGCGGTRGHGQQRRLSKHSCAGMSRPCRAGGLTCQSSLANIWLGIVFFY